MKLLAELAGDKQDEERVKRFLAELERLAARYGWEVRAVRQGLREIDERDNSR